jgi:sec-independent protein translocase protein TatA
MTELLVILAVVIVAFGPSRIKGLGPALGRSIRGFKDEMKGDDSVEDSEEPSQLENKPAQREIDVTRAGSVEHED